MQSPLVCSLLEFKTMTMVRLDSWLTMESYILDPSQASIIMAKLQNPVKSSFDSINESLKESHSSLNKYSKTLDKVSRQPSHKVFKSRTYLI